MPLQSCKKISLNSVPICSLTSPLLIRQPSLRSAGERTHRK